MASATSPEEAEVFDVIIIGAGPCGLATAARLREHAPAALFTDEEHRRYHWIGKHGSKVSLKHVRSGKVSSAAAPPAAPASNHRARRPEYKMAILDDTDDRWLSRWKTSFNTFDISHLRSPMLWHLDPLDRDALLAHAYRNEREHELVEIRNCVGKEMSKHSKKKQMGNCHKACGNKQSARVAINLRERNDYYTPSQSLFCDHCDDVIHRYRLGGADLIQRESLQELDYSVVHGVSAGDEKLFTVTSNQGIRYAKTVILAVGPANVAKIPQLPSMPSMLPLPQACHSSQMKAFPDPSIKERFGPSLTATTTNILIVGGGLTSAQIADLAIRKGTSKVWLLMRGPCRVKHFDVALDWMGKYKNAEQARFWTADSDTERLEMIKEARGGGSITPLFHKRVKKHVASGKLELRTHTHLVDAQFEERGDADGGGGGGGLSKWTVKTEPAIPELPAFDYIYFATGIQTDFTKLPYLQTMLQKHPIKGYGGFPCLNEDLMWKEDIPLFLVGRLAALQLGPAAPNIGGAKLGAERVAWAIEDLIQPSGAEEWAEREESRGMKEYLSGHGNMYSALAVE